MMSHAAGFAARMAIVTAIALPSVSSSPDRISAQSAKVATPPAVSAQGKGRPRPNRRPRAVIAHVEHAILDEPITLNGSRSSDPDGDALHFHWTLQRAPHGSRAKIVGATSALAELTPDVPGMYSVRLSVSDGSLSDSASDEFRVRNHRPRAEIAPVGQVFVTQRVTLDGTRSSDRDGDPLAFSWRFLSRPRNSQAVLVNATTATPAFVVDRPGVYRVELEVSDGSASDRARVRIRTSNSPPTANAGPDQTVTRNTVVTLDGGGSTDIDGDPLTYQWGFVSLPPASAATLSDPAAVRPTFVVDLAGAYTLRLVVSDGQASSQADVVIINTGNSPPVANAGPDRTVTRGATVLLDASGSSDVDGDPLTYFWEFVAVPAGSTAVLSNPTTVQPTFVADRRGDFVLRLTVRDAQASSEDTVTISTENTPPVANAGVDRASPLGATVTLDGSGSTDVDGDSLTYQWSLISVPAGSAAALANPSAVAPTFVVDLHGEYVAQLIVNDGRAASNADTVTISTENTRPVAEAGPNQSVLAGAIVLLDGSGSRDPDGDALRYTWSLTTVPPGSTAALNDSNSITPSFVADQPGAYLAQLVVDDGRLSSLPDTVIVTTTMNTAPVANAGPDQSNVVVGALVTLDGSASGDADGHNLTFQWSLLSVPAGSAAVLSVPTAVKPTFVPDLPGDYVAQLIVHDGFVPSAPDTVQIQVRAANRPPVADAGPDQMEQI